MTYAAKPDIGTRQTIDHCLDHVEDMEFAKSLRLRLALIGEESKIIPKPLKVVDGTEFYLRLNNSCPYKNCPNAIAAMTLRGPRAGEVLALCADPDVGRAYIAMTSFNPADTDQIM